MCHFSRRWQLVPWREQCAASMCARSIGLFVVMYILLSVTVSDYYHLTVSHVSVYMYDICCRRLSVEVQSRRSLSEVSANESVLCPGLSDFRFTVCSQIDPFKFSLKILSDEALGLISTRQRICSSDRPKI